jgi:hypothetical protein
MTSSQNRITQMLKVQEEGIDLFNKKNKDYGDAFAKYGAVGIIVRMGDKISRLQTISKNNITLVETEKVRDTLIDLHNYAAMAIMLIDEEEEILLVPKNECKIESLSEIKNNHYK